MAYELDKLGRETLQKILLVVRDIRHQAELQDKVSGIDMRWVEGIEGVPRNDHKNIMANLIEQRLILKEPDAYGGQLYLNVDLEILDHFAYHVEEELKKFTAPPTSSPTALAQPSFDEKSGVLLFKGNSIRITLRDEQTVAHGILTHIFRGKHGPLNAEYYFAELAEYEFGDLNYSGNEKAWKRYYTACNDINEKIRKNTPDRIEDFLIFNTGKRAHVRINPRYL